MRLNEDEMRNMKVLKFLVINSHDFFSDRTQAILDGIWELLFVNDIKILIAPSGLSNNFTRPRALQLRQKLWGGLAKNGSIQKMKVEYYQINHDEISWTDTEKKQLEYLMQRNTSITQSMTMPKLIPLSVWTLMLEVSQKTGVGLNPIFQCLHGIVECLLDTTTEVTGRHAKRKVNFLN